MFLQEKKHTKLCVGSQKTHTGQDLGKNNRSKGKPAQVASMAREHRQTILRGMEPNSQGEMEIMGCA